MLPKHNQMQPPQQDSNELYTHVSPTYSKSDPEQVVKAAYYRKKPIARPTLHDLQPGKHYGLRKEYTSNKEARKQIAVLLQPNKLPPYLARKNRTYLMNLLVTLESKNKHEY